MKLGFLAPLFAAALSSCMLDPAFAQTVQGKLTVSVTNTYQQIIPPDQSRKDCLIQYIPVAGTKGFIFFGAAAPADTTTSFQLGASQSINCSSAQFAQKKGIWVTATGTDIFVLLEDAGSEP